MIQFTTTILFILGALYGATDQGVSETSNPSLPLTVQDPITLEQYVRDYFVDEPILAEIAKCESRFRHINRNGTVVRGELTPQDVGIMQINEFYHEERAEKLGFNLHTLDGNLAYAKWLYTKEGTVPWRSSGKCWQKEQHSIAKSKVDHVTANRYD